MSTLWRDIVFGLKILARKRSLNVIIIVTLAVGIGANSAIFTLFDRLIMHPLTGVQTSGLVRLSASRQAFSMSFPNFADLQSALDSFKDLIAYSSNSISLGGGGPAERVLGGVVSSNYFSALGVAPVIGRTFSKEEGLMPGRDAVAVISYRVWQSRFGGNPKVVGRAIRINGKPFEVIGVAPEEFGGLDIGFVVDVWTLLSMASQAWLPLPNVLERRSLNWLFIWGRLREGTPPDAAEAEIRAVASNLAGSGETFDPTDIELLSAQEGYVGTTRKEQLGPMLSLLGGTVLFLLLIVCANVANLLLAQNKARRREMAVRSALGASRWRLIRQLGVEGLILSMAGGLAAFLITFWAGDLFRFFTLSNVRLERIDFVPDWGVALFSFAVSLAAFSAFALVPALTGTRTDLTEDLRSAAARSLQGVGQNKMRQLLVVQVALAVTLLVGCGLFLRTCQQLWSVDVGYRTEGVLSNWLRLSMVGYDAERGQILYQNLLERVRSLPAVESAAVTSHLPAGPVLFVRDVLFSEPALQTPDPVTLPFAGITPGYFKTVGINLLRGRDFSSLDTEGSAPVAIVSDALARQRWPNEPAVGQWLQLVDPQGDEMTPVHVVGVVSDIRPQGPRDEVSPLLYLPMAQDFSSTAFLMVHFRGELDPLVRQIRQELFGLAPDLPAFDFHTLGHLVEETFAQERALATLIGLFAGIAIILASVGVYGLLNDNVSQRRGEIGIRLALGADRANILRLMVRHALGPVILGLFLGLAASFWLTRFIHAMLFGVEAGDPVTVLAVSALFLAVAGFASYWPARRASRLDPLETLRCE